LSLFLSFLFQKWKKGILTCPNLSHSPYGTKEFSNLSRRFSGGKLFCPVGTG